MSVDMEHPNIDVTSGTVFKVAKDEETGCITITGERHGKSVGMILTTHWLKVTTRDIQQQIAYKMGLIDGRFDQECGVDRMIA